MRPLRQWFYHWRDLPQSISAWKSLSMANSQTKNPRTNQGSCWVQLGLKKNNIFYLHRSKLDKESPWIKLPSLRPLLRDLLWCFATGAISLRAPLHRGERDSGSGAGRTPWRGLTLTLGSPQQERGVYKHGDKGLQQRFTHWGAHWQRTKLVTWLRIDFITFITTLMVLVHLSALIQLPVTWDPLAGHVFGHGWKLLTTEIYIYIYIHTHTYIYTHICIERERDIHIYIYI